MAEKLIQTVHVEPIIKDINNISYRINETVEASTTTSETVKFIYKERKTIKYEGC